MERSAQESYIAADRLAAGQAADGLVYDRLKNGSRQILAGRPFIDQRLDVGLGEYAAAGGDGIDGLIIFRVFIEAHGVCLKQGRHLVDKGTGASGADPIHALVDAAGKVNDFRVLAAQLDGDVSLRRKVLERGGHSHDFLDKRNM